MSFHPFPEWSGATIALAGSLHPLRLILAAMFLTRGDSMSILSAVRRRALTFEAMPYSFVIDLKTNVIRETWFEKVDVAQLYESCEQEWADPTYRSDMNMLSDFRNAELEISFEEMRTFATFMGSQEAVKRHAIVVGRQVGFGLARMFTALSESSSPYWDSLRVFFEYEEADRWVSSQ